MPRRSSMCFVSFVTLGILLLGLPSAQAADDRVDLRSGQWLVSEVDLSAPAGGVQIELRRVASSLDVTSGTFGPAWRMSVEKRIGAGDGERAEAFDEGREVYLADGRLARIEYDKGGVVRLVYDARGRITTIEGDAGVSIRLTRDQAGHVVRAEATDGRFATYAYEGDRLAEVRVNGGSLTRYGYDQHNRLTMVATPHSGRVDAELDRTGRVLARRFADGSRESRSYDDAARTVRLTDAAGATSTLTWSADNRQEESIDAEGRKTVLERDADGRVVRVVGPGGEAASIAYDGSGRIVRSGPAGRETVFTYDGSSSRVRTLTAPGGRRQEYAYDARGILRAIREDGQDLLAMEYDARGLPIAVRRRGEPDRRITYSPEGRIVSESDSAGHAWTYAYDTRGNMVRLSFDGRTTEYAYDEQDRLITEKDAAGGTQRYEYDEANRVVRHIDAAWNATRFEYDAVGRLKTTTDPLGRTTSYQYDLAGRCVAIVEPGGATTRYTYDRTGQRTSDTDPAGGVTRYEYDGAGRIARAIDPSGHASTYEYSSTGQLTRIAGPGPLLTRLQYDERGRKAGWQDAAMPAVSLERDSRGRVVRIQGSGGVVREFTYDAAGQITSERSSIGPRSDRSYDAAGRLLHERTAGGTERWLKYGPGGLLLAERDNRGLSRRNEYDARGWLVASTDSSGRILRYAYDAAGRATQEADGLGNVRRMVYDPAGTLVQRHEANGDAVQYEYGAAGHLDSVRLQGETRYRYVRDAAGRITSVTDAGGRARRFTYDNAGRLTQETGADGKVTAYRYSDAGVLSEQTAPDGTVTRFRRDAAGRVLETDDGRFPVRQTFDELGRRTRLEYPTIGRALGWTYDSSGMLTAMRAPDGRELTYEYDEHQRPAAIVLPDARRIRFAYDAAGRLQRVDYPNGVSGTWDWDWHGRLAKISYARDGKALDGWASKYDTEGRLIETTRENDAPVSYRYDPSGQLVEESTSANTTRYGYLPGGQRSRRDAGTRTDLYAYDASARLTAAGPDRFVYNERGHLVERVGPAGRTTYEWDANGRLVRATLPRGSAITWGYSATGERVSRQDGGTTRRFMTDGVNLIADLDERANVVALYVHAPGVDRPLAVIGPDGTQFYHVNGLGSVGSLSDDKGAVVVRYQTDAFGLVTGTTGSSPNRFVHAAREWEPAAGLYYVRARYYDPALGRFISPDPDWAAQTEPLRVNGYAYALNAPTRYIDWNGANEIPADAIHARFGVNPAQLAEIEAAYISKLGVDPASVRSRVAADFGTYYRRYGGTSLYERALAGVDDEVAYWKGIAEMSGGKVTGPDAPRAIRQPMPSVEVIDARGVPRRQVGSAEAEASRMATGRGAPAPRPAAPRPRSGTIAEPAPGDVLDRPGSRPVMAGPQLPPTTYVRARASTFAPQSRIPTLDVEAKHAGTAITVAAGLGMEVMADWEEGRDLGESVLTNAASTTLVLALAVGASKVGALVSVPAALAGVAAVGAPAVGATVSAYGIYSTLQTASRLSSAVAERPAREAERRSAQAVAVNTGLADSTIAQLDVAVTQELVALDALQAKYLESAMSVADSGNARTIVEGMRGSLAALRTEATRAGAGFADAPAAEAVAERVRGEAKRLATAAEALGIRARDAQTAAGACAAEADASRALALHQEGLAAASELAQAITRSRAEATRYQNDSAGQVRAEEALKRIEELRGRIVSDADRLVQLQSRFDAGLTGRESARAEYRRRLAAIQQRIATVRGALGTLTPDQQSAIVAIRQRTEARSPSLTGTGTSDETPARLQEFVAQAVEMKLDAQNLEAQATRAAANTAAPTSLDAELKSLEASATAVSQHQATLDGIPQQVELCRQRLKEDGAQPGGFRDLGGTATPAPPAVQREAPQPPQTPAPAPSPVPQSQGFQDLGGTAPTPRPATPPQGFQDLGTPAPTPAQGTGRAVQPPPPPPSSPTPQPVSRTTFAAGQPAAWHIFATGSRLGWAAGLGEYSVGPADHSIIEHLQTAGEHVMWANRESRPPTLAWPGWSATRATVRGWADDLARTQRNDVRRRIARDAASAISGLAPQLDYQTAGDTAPRATCDAAYVRLGFELGYGQQAMLVADEAVRNADRRAAVAPRQDALSHLRSVVSVLINYDQIRVASGRCADLRDVRTLVERVLATNANDIATQAATATAAWELANERIAALRNDGATVAAPTPIPQATAPSRPPPAAAAPPAVPAPGGTSPIRLRSDGYYVARNPFGGLQAIRFISDRSLRIAVSEPVWSGQMTGNPPMPVPAPPEAQRQRVVWLLQQLPGRWQGAESADLTFERQGDTIPLRKADPLALTRYLRIPSMYVRCNDFAELELASEVEFFLQPRCRPGFRKIPFEFVPHAW